MKDNEQSLAILRSKMELFTKHQKTDFAESIELLKRKAAAEGSLGSGNTIKNACILLEEYLGNRAEYLFSTLQGLPLYFHKSLAPELDAIVKKYLPMDFHDFRDHVLNTIRMAAGGANQLVTTGLEMSSVINAKVIERNGLEIEQFLHNLSANQEASTKEKWYLCIEGILVLFTVFLAGCWVADPSGNYEPWTIIIGCIAASTEIFRRIKTKNT